MRKDISLIIMAAGESSRFRAKCRVKKQWIRADSKPLWQFVADRFAMRYEFRKIIITASSDEVAYMRRFCDYEIVCGGETRSKSLQNALKLVESEFVAVSDTARFDLDFDVIERLFSYDMKNIDCLIPVISVNDTILLESKNDISYLDRENVRLVQTPQLSRTEMLKAALNRGDFSDESSAIKSFGGKIAIIQGSKKLNKLTHFEDLINYKSILDSKDSRDSRYFRADSMDLRRDSRDSSDFQDSRDFVESADSRDSADFFSGYGFDVHKFSSTKKDLFLGGVKIPSDVGLEAHSDGDVVIHALCDSLLGAIGAGDIGEWFPPNDENYKNADSKDLLQKVVDFIFGVGFEILNVDIMIMAQKPIILPYKNAMIECVARILEIRKNRVNIKATTMEKMGFVGREEGICVSAIATLKYAKLNF